MSVEPHPIDLELTSLSAEATPEERLAVIWRYYVVATGNQLENPPSEEARRRVYQWLKSLRAGVDGDRAPTFLLRRLCPQLMASLSPLEKAYSLFQQNCGTCDGVQDANGAYARMIPIEVDHPWSAQASHARNSKLKKAVNDMLQQHYRGHDEAQRISLIMLDEIPYL